MVSASVLRDVLDIFGPREGFEHAICGHDVIVDDRSVGFGQGPMTDSEVLHFVGAEKILNGITGKRMAINRRYSLKSNEDPGARCGIVYANGDRLSLYPATESKREYLAGHEHIRFQRSSDSLNLLHGQLHLAWLQVRDIDSRGTF